MVASILEAAGDLLGKGSENPAEIPMQKIADRAGVGIGSVYDYFANSEGIWGGFVEWINERNFAALEQKTLGTGTTFTARLPSLVDATLSLYLDAPGRTRGAVIAIVRMGWIERTVLQRDRFEHLLAQKLGAEHPHVPRGAAGVEGARRARSRRGARVARWLSRLHSGRDAAGTRARGREELEPRGVVDRRRGHRLFREVLTPRQEMPVRPPVEAVALLPRDSRARARARATSADSAPRASSGAGVAR